MLGKLPLTLFKVSLLYNQISPLPICFLRDFASKIQMFYRYSGDWSRIGVISKESEELLKVAAFLVTPLCLFLVFYLSKDEEA